MPDVYPMKAGESYTRKDNKSEHLLTALFLALPAIFLAVL